MNHIKMKPYIFFLHEYLYFQVHFGVNLRFHNQFFACTLRVILTQLLLELILTKIKV